jgi:hypothetical protein
MLRLVGHKLLDAWHHLLEESLAFEERAEAGNLPCNSTPHLRFSVLEKLYECGNQVSVDDLLIDGFRDLDRLSLDMFHRRCTYLLEPISNHVAHPPALVLEQTPQRRQKHAMARLLLLGHCLCDCDQDIYRQKPDTVLVVGRKVLEEGNHLVNDDRRWHALDKLGEVVGSLSSHHGGIVVHELAIVLPELLLRWRGSSCIRYAVEAGRRDFGGEPVGL